MELRQRMIDCIHILYPVFLNDTDARKTGKCMEFIGKIFSHVTRKHGLRYKSLNLCYWSGKHLLHCDFFLHVEMGTKGDQGLSIKKRKAPYNKDRPDHSPGNSRKGEATEKRTNSALKMLRRAVSKGFKAPYILADSWFFCF